MLFFVQGARTSELHLSNFESGRYIIRLTVTDASEQEDTATVTVTVLPVSKLLVTTSYIVRVH